MKAMEIREELLKCNDRRVWPRGVTAYAIELVEDIEESLGEEFEMRHDGSTRRLLLNGAESWVQYSYGGCALICDADIAERLCCASAPRRRRNGERKPNRDESWLDVQARALAQAERRIWSVVDRRKTVHP